jgi:hypothetical protein
LPEPPLPELALPELALPELALPELALPELALPELPPGGFLGSPELMSSVLKEFAPMSNE